MGCKWESGSKPQSSRFKGAWAELICQAFKQRRWWQRRLVVIIWDLSHPSVCLFRHVCSDKAEFSFLQNKTTFWCSFKRVSNWRLVGLMYSLPQSLQGIEEMVSVRCTSVTGSLTGCGYSKSLDGFRNTLNVRNNSKTSRWFPFIRRATSCHTFLAVTEKSFCTAIRL